MAVVVCSDAIVDWVKKKTGPPSTLVSTTDAVEQATQSTKVLVLGYFATLEVRPVEEGGTNGHGPGWGGDWAGREGWRASDVDGNAQNTGDRVGMPTHVRRLSKGSG